jgi:hypothetical protein
MLDWLVLKREEEDGFQEDRLGGWQPSGSQTESNNLNFSFSTICGKLVQKLRGLRRENEHLGQH